MAAGVVIKHKRKAGAFVNGELQAGELGVDVSGNACYFSTNGTTVQALGSSGNMTKAVYDTNDDGKVNAASDADALGGVAAASYATKAYADSAVATAVGAAPAALNTLVELATALGNDANFASTMTTALAGKAAASHTHNATDINAGDLATARMQVNAAAALQAQANTLNSANLVIDGGTI